MKIEIKREIHEIDGASEIKEGDVFAAKGRAWCLWRAQKIEGDLITGKAVGSNTVLTFNKILVYKKI